MKAVLAEAGIEGAHASPKGLRHGFGVRAIQKTRNPRLVQIRQNLEVRRRARGPWIGGELAQIADSVGLKKT